LWWFFLSKSLLPDLQPDEFCIVNRCHLIGDEVERSAGDVGAGDGVPVVGL